MPEVSDKSLKCSVLAASLLTSIGDGLAIFIAKSFNSAVAQTIVPSLACTESPGSSLTNLGLQGCYCIGVLVVLTFVWLKASSMKTNEFWTTLKFMFGEMIGWAFKEFTAILAALIAFSMMSGETEDGEEGSTSGRKLRDYLQGDAAFESNEAWMHVLSYLIMSAILSVLVHILFLPLLSTIQKLFWCWASTYIRFIFCGKTESGEGETEKDGAKEGEEKEDEKDEPFSRDESDDLAKELITECTKISFAWSVNGLIIGIFSAIFVKSFGENSKGFSAFGILEAYVIVQISLGAALYKLEGENMKALDDYYNDFFIYLGGLAISSLGTSPGGVTALALNSGLNETVIDFIRAIVSSIIAIIFIYKGCSTRVTRNLFGCFQVSTSIAKKVGHVFTLAAGISLAAAWEDFGGDLACSLQSEGGLPAWSIVWIYTAAVNTVLFPLVLVVGKYATKKTEEVEKVLETLYENQDEQVSKDAGDP